MSDETRDTAFSFPVELSKEVGLAPIGGPVPLPYNPSKIRKRMFLAKKCTAENVVDGHLNNILGYDWQTRFPNLLSWFSKRGWNLSHNALGVGTGMARRKRVL